MLLEINNAIITTRKQEALLNAISHAMHSVIPYDQFGISLYDPEADLLRYFAIEGMYESEHFTVGRILKLDDSLSGKVFTSRRAVLRRDLEVERQYSSEHAAFAEGIRSICTVPLIMQGKHIGVMGAASKIRYQYTEETIELLQEVATQVALALSNVKAYEDIRALSEREARTAERRRSLLEINNAIATKLTQQELCEAVFAALQRLVPFDRAGLSLFDQEQDAYRIIALGGAVQTESFAVGRLVSRQENWVTEQFRAGHPWFRPDLAAVERSPFEEQLFREGLRSFCAVPLLVQGNVMGALSVSSQMSGRYAQADVELLQEVANQVAIAIANMRAYEEVAALNAAAAARAERRRTLLEITNAVVTHLTQNELLRAIVPAVRRIISFDTIGITIYEPEVDGYRMVAIEGDNPSTKYWVGQLVPRGDSKTGQFIEKHQPFLVHDLADEQSRPFERELFAVGFRSFCSVGLIIQGAVIGNIGVVSRQVGAYSREDAEFLQEVANQIALSLQNSQLYEEMKLEAGRRQRTEEMLRAITEGTAAVMGMDFFMSLVHHLATTLQLRFALISECIGESTGRVRTLAFWQGDRFGENFEYNVADTPCSGVIEGRVCYYPSDVQQRFPKDADLQVLGAESYLGVTIFNTRGQAVGHLAVMDDRAMADDPWRVSVLKTFAARAGAELERLRADTALRAALAEVECLKNQLQAENLYLQEEIRTEHNFEEIVGSSRALLETLRQVEQVAPTDSTVLILGETGTGKEHIARAIHHLSRRKVRPIVKVNCGAISGGLVESELFGHTRGAFTGAVDKRVGRFELADAGTIFLDEVGELPLDTQVKLLRVLQEGEFEAVGSSRTMRVDVRVIAATNRNLEDEVKAGRFRADLFYRLNVFPIMVPALRERHGDVAQLVNFFVPRLAKKFGKRIRQVSHEAMEALVRYAWPGNIRELQNIIERAIVLAASDVVTLSLELIPRLTAAVNVATPNRNLVPPVASQGPEAPASRPQPGELKLSLAEIERQHILAGLHKAGWVIEGPKGAARLLNLNPNTLRSRMRKLGIRRPGS